MKLTKRQEMVFAAIEAAWEDDGFKESLITSPVQAISRLTGQSFSLPPGTHIEFVDCNDVDITEDRHFKMIESYQNFIRINIPASPQLNDMILSDDVLEEVVGGTIIKQVRRRLKIGFVKLLSNWRASH